MKQKILQMNKLNFFGRMEDNILLLLQNLKVLMKKQHFYIENDLKKKDYNSGMNHMKV